MKKMLEEKRFTFWSGGIRHPIFSLYKQRFEDWVVMRRILKILLCAEVE